MKEKVVERVGNLWGEGEIKGYSETIGYHYSRSIGAYDAGGSNYIYKKDEPRKFAKIKLLVGEHFTSTTDKELIRKIKKIAKWRMK